MIDDRLDVIVSLENEHCTDEFSYVIEVTTPQCLSALMEEFESSFLPPCDSIANILEIFKKFEYLHDFKLQIFRSTLDDSLSLNSDFNANELSSIVIIPFFKIKKEKNVCYVTLLVAKQFYEYNFPFQFKDYFLIWKSTHQFEVKIQILQLLAQPRPKKSVCQAAEGSWQDTNDPNKYYPNRPSQESIVATEHLGTFAIITDSDIKRIMTPEDRIIPKDRLDQTQKINERFKRAEIGMRIANPAQVFEKIYKGKECKIFVTVDTEGTIRSAILNRKSGRLLIDTKLSDKEYA